jgi:hypothetical protein
LKTAIAASCAANRPAAAGQSAMGARRPTGCGQQMRREGIGQKAKCLCRKGAKAQRPLRIQLFNSFDFFDFFDGRRVQKVEEVEKW